MTRLCLGILALSFVLACGEARAPAEAPDADVIIVGAGIAGLSAAVEIARGGADAIVVDMASVFGGHAVSAHGGLAIVGSPVQTAQGIEDTHDLAIADFLTWGEDADEAWVRYYVENSRAMIHDWAVDLGVEFEDLWLIPGNSVARFHNVRGRGLGLVTPIFVAALRAGVTFRWNTRVDELLVEDGAVVGVRGTNLRDESVLEFRAPAVLLSTGGFQSNLERVEANWSTETTFPDRILAGSGWHSQGLGLDLAGQAGAAFHRLDHQWNYVTGLPDPRYPGAERGLNFLADLAVWVNLAGERFVTECASAKEAMPALLRQPTGSYWQILDARVRESVVVSGSGWTEERVETLIMRDTALVKTAATVRELARAAGIPEGALVETIERFNRFVAGGADPDFQRFGYDDDDLPCRDVSPLDQPPFYAVRLYPLARKSMGGIAIDTEARVLDSGGPPISGLYAAGEAAGFGGINGRAGLEGTFLGPSILTGRVAARSMLAALSASGRLDSDSRPAQAATPSQQTPTGAPAYGNSECTECHDLNQLVDAGRPGYWHFELSHRAILESAWQCSQCHGPLAPYEESSHRVDPLRRAASCGYCHGLQAID